MGNKDVRVGKIYSSSIPNDILPVWAIKGNEMIKVFDKLVRDKIPDIIQRDIDSEKRLADGIPVTASFATVSGDALELALAKKLVEEATEYYNAVLDKQANKIKAVNEDLFAMRYQVDERLSEFADVTTIFTTIQYQFTSEEFRRVNDEVFSRRDSRGGFDNGLVLLWVEFK